MPRAKACLRHISQGEPRAPFPLRHSDFRVAAFGRKPPSKSFPKCGALPRRRYAGFSIYKLLSTSSRAGGGCAAQRQFRGHYLDARNGGGNFGLNHQAQPASDGGFNDEHFPGPGALLAKSCLRRRLAMRYEPDNALRTLAQSGTRARKRHRPSRAFFGPAMEFCRTGARRGKLSRPVRRHHLSAGAHR